VYGVSSTMARVGYSDGRLRGAGGEVLFNFFIRTLALFGRRRGAWFDCEVPLDSAGYRQISPIAGLRASATGGRQIIERAGTCGTVAALVPPGIPRRMPRFKYILAHRKFTVIPERRASSRRVTTCRRNRAAVRDVVRAIHAFWERELKDNPLPW